MQDARLEIVAATQDIGTRRSLTRAWMMLAVVLALAGCAETTIRTAWLDPGYTGGAFHKIVVAGVQGTVADRRVFEDVFSNHLRAAGIDAVPGYQLIPDDAKGDEPRWNAAVQGSGADGVLVARLVRIDTRTQVTTALVPAPWVMGTGPYGWYPGWVTMPDVRQYDVAIIETTLFDVRSRKVVWAATSETFNVSDVGRQAASMAETIIRELAQRGLLTIARRS